jgi:hypothetical protein
MSLLRSPSVNEERKSFEKLDCNNMPVMALERGASKKPFIDGLEFTTKFLQELSLVYEELKKTLDSYVELLISKPKIMHKILSTIRDKNYQDYIGMPSCSLYRPQGSLLRRHFD